MGVLLLFPFLFPRFVYALPEFICYYIFIAFYNNFIVSFGRGPSGCESLLYTSPRVFISSVYINTEVYYFLMFGEVYSINAYFRGISEVFTAFVVKLDFSTSCESCVVFISEYKAVMGFFCVSTGYYKKHFLTFSY